jgi:hypothetical protein
MTSGSIEQRRTIHDVVKLFLRIRSVPSPGIQLAQFKVVVVQDIMVELRISTAYRPLCTLRHASSRATVIRHYIRATTFIAAHARVMQDEKV